MGTEGQAGVEIVEPLLSSAGAGAGAAEEAAVGARVPPWTEQITVRGLAVSALLGTLFCVITHKLNLTVGVIPSLNVAAGLLGFFFVKSWTGLLSKLGIWTVPFTPQENTVIQTCVVACYGLAFSGNCHFCPRRPPSLARGPRSRFGCPLESLGESPTGFHLKRKESDRR